VLLLRVEVEHFSETYVLHQQAETHHDVFEGWVGGEVLHFVETFSQVQHWLFVFVEIDFVLAGLAVVLTHSVGVDFWLEGFKVAVLVFQVHHGGVFVLDVVHVESIFDVGLDLPLSFVVEVAPGELQLHLVQTLRYVVLVESLEIGDLSDDFDVHDGTGKV